ncbi:MAG: thioredoxin domain-containing protein, partial [Thiohalomonadaceae bacterium]
PGGWPLTVFLAPDQTPFFAGTYFPKQRRYGMPPFTEVLTRVATFWRDHREELDDQNASLRAALAQVEGDEGMAARLDDHPLTAARTALAASYDPRHGGFGGAPKFPHSQDLALLLRLAVDGDGEAARMTLHSLRAMADGGLFDHLGGGFFRYAVDAHWGIPHFEKMLYDNALLLPLYAEAWRFADDESLRAAAERTGEWVMREMQSPQGGYYATLDADSEGEEGRFYVWTREELAAALAPEDFPLAAALYGLDGPTNFEERWHLQRRRSHADIAAELGLSAAEVAAGEARVRTALFQARAGRVRPGRDEKILAGWNGLMIGGMATAGRLLDRADFVASAERALDFLRRHLVTQGRLLAAWKDGIAVLPGYLDDHAFLLDGLLALLEARWRDGDLSFALQLADLLLEHFEDEARGGFYFTADDHERLIHRPRSFADESLPSGNGVAARALLRLGHLVGRLDYTDAAERTLRAAWSHMDQHPVGHGAMLLALREFLSPGPTVVLRGSGDALAPWHSVLARAFDHGRHLLVVPEEAQDLPGTLAERSAQDAPVAYVCEPGHCLPPIREPQGLADALR